MSLSPEPSPMFSLSSVVPWGSSFDEYQRMFALTRPTCAAILGCGDGPASFNAATPRGPGRFLRPALPVRRRANSGRIDEGTGHGADAAERQLRLGRHPPTSSARSGMAPCEAFLADYSAGRDGRYVGRSARPAVRRGAFDLALCSHFLFLYRLRHAGVSPAALAAMPCGARGACFPAAGARRAAFAAPGAGDGGARERTVS